MHILLPETDNCPSWIRGGKRMTVENTSPETNNCPSPSWICRRDRMTIENISWIISMKECCRTWQTRNLLITSQDVHPTEPQRTSVNKSSLIWVYSICSGFFKGSNSIKSQGKTESSWKQNRKYVVFLCIWISKLWRWKLLGQFQKVRSGMKA